MAGSDRLVPATTGSVVPVLAAVARLDLSTRLWREGFGSLTLSWVAIGALMPPRGRPAHKARYGTLGAGAHMSGFDHRSAKDKPASDQFSQA